MQVVILAAGLGTRLGGDAPKPLAPIGAGVTLLGNQVDIFTHLIGRERITLVLGHRADDVRAVFPDLNHAINSAYAQTNTAKSLLLALEMIDDDDVLWTNGDVYFEAPTISRFLDAGHLGSRLLVNCAPTDDEEIKYKLASDGAVCELSKHVDVPDGESLGVQLVTRSDLPELRRRLTHASDNDYFEKALESGVKESALRLMTVDIGDDFCMEVDFPADLEHVRRRVAELEKMREQ